MDYNTQRKLLSLPEYGRNIQNMVNYICTIKNKEKRNKLSYEVIAVMGNTHPHLKNIPEFKHKLWLHLGIMANYKLDIDSPYPIPLKSEKSEKPKMLPYNNTSIRYKHYGRLILKAIQHAIDYDKPDKDRFVCLIANQMKKSFLLWNKNTVDDKKIGNDLAELSRNKLILKPDQSLLTDGEILNRLRKKKTLVKSR